MPRARWHALMPERPVRKHLKRLPRITVEAQVYFITVCTIRRQQILVGRPLADVVTRALRHTAEMRGWHVGKYVLMPDHIHFFCAPGDAADLSRFVGGFKQESTRRSWEAGWQGRLWQREFFDHLLRDGESYEQNWWYVRNNPVRAGLCLRPEDWAWQGEMARL